MLRPLAALVLILPIALGGGAALAGALEDGLAAYQSSDYAASRTALLPLAKAGNAEAQFYLGLMAYHGRGMEVDRTQAAEWYGAAAKQDHRPAQFNLGLMLATGRGVAIDKAAALRLFTAAAEAGLAMAQYRLAFMYGVGEVVKKDDVVSARWNLRAAEQGEPRAQYSLGFQYAKGMGVGRDLVESIKWLTLSSERYPNSPSRARVIQLRDAVTRLASREQQDEAMRRAKAWTPKPESAGALPALAEDGSAESSPSITTVARTPAPSAAPPETPPAPAPQPTEAAPSAAPAAPETPVEAAPLGTRIQVGAYRSEATALEQWQRLVSAHEVVLGDLEPIIERIDLGEHGGIFYRLQAGPFASREEAGGACDRLRARNLDCRVRSP